jgi:hypothetical protein
MTVSTGNVLVACEIARPPEQVVATLGALVARATCFGAALGHRVLLNPHSTSPAAVLVLTIKGRPVRLLVQLAKTDAGIVFYASQATRDRAYVGSAKLEPCEIGCRVTVRLAVRVGRLCTKSAARAARFGFYRALALLKWIAEDPRGPAALDGMSHFPVTARS